ncbi:AtpZ/AtpI family protein [Patescibacteria group bacterium]|nr:AtpZ/AtpI family protein [Patescibacteria group bacterium]
MKDYRPFLDTNMPDDKKPKPASTYSDLLKPAQMLTTLGFVIAIPLVILALTGRWLDRIYESSPVFLLISIFAAFFISSHYIYTKMVKYYVFFDEKEKKEK